MPPSLMRRSVAHVLLAAAARSTNVARQLCPPPPPEPPTEHELTFERWRELEGDRTYRVRYDLDAESLVWDVGGYRGDWSAEIAARYGSTIEIFEPVSAFAAEIRARFARNPMVTVHPFALGAATRTDRIALDGDRSSTSVDDGQSTEEIRVVDVLEQLERVAPREVALLKLNVEGSEYEVLDRLIDSGRISAVRHLQVQFHDFVPEATARREALCDTLARTHSPTYSFPWVWEGWERIEV